MKSATTGLLKFKRLQRLLGESKRGVVGLLELLWQETTRQAPRGDIGRFSNEEIAILCDWDGDPDRLIEALIETNWLDIHSEHRLIIHDWADHAPQWLRNCLKAKRSDFVSQDQPGDPTGDHTPDPTGDHTGDNTPDPAPSRDSSLRLRLRLSSPLPPPPPDATGEDRPSASEEEEEEGQEKSWQEVDAVLAATGIGSRRKALDHCIATVTPRYVLDVVEFWNDHRTEWTAGALYTRLCNAHRELAPSEGWPKPRGQPAAPRRPTKTFETWRAAEVKRIRASGNEVPSDDELLSRFKSVSKNGALAVK
jgi:hypothetical protein